MGKVITGVAKINADTVDGKHADEFLLVGDKAVDSDKLNGLDSTDFLLVNAPAVGIDGDDTRSINYEPQAYMSSGARYLGRAGLQSEFKGNTAIGVQSIITGTYCQLITLNPWSDGSGGFPVQIAVGANGQLAIRTGSSNTVWGSWGKMWSTLNTTVDVNGFIKAI